MLTRIVLVSLLAGLASSEDDSSSRDLVFRKGNELMWCCLSAEELVKCKAFAEAAKAEHDKDEYTFGSYYRPIKCKQYFNKDECMRVVDQNSPEHPNLMTVDAGEVFVGGRYHSLVPILTEVYDRGHEYFHSVAVVKRGALPHVQTLADLKGAKACFAKVGSLAGWTVPIYRLMDAGVIEISDCNNHVKSAIDFFGTSCAVNSLQDRYNPLGDNSHHFCELCGSHTPGVRCTNRDPYAEYTGALLCLKEKGDVAFLNDKVVFESQENQEEYELLCPEEGTYGILTRRPLTAYEDCSWGVSPSNAIVVSSAMGMEQRQAIQIFLQKAVELFGNADSRSAFADSQRNASRLDPDYDDTIGDRPYPGSPSQDPRRFDDDRFGSSSNDGFSSDPMRDSEDEEEGRGFKIFESAPRYGMLNNLLISDNTRSLKEVRPDDMSYKSFLGRTYGGALSSPMKAIEGIRKCPVGDMKLCVTSEAELIKCIRMRTALNAQLLSPKMSCKRARSHMDCMRQIHVGESDVVVLDAGDVYKAGWQFGLIPIMAEIYNLGTPHYYAVAVTKQRDNSSELIYLKRKNTCHTGVGHAAGWVVPMAWLIANERVRDYECDSVRAAAEYFNKACAPGAQNAHFQNRYESNYWEYSHLCDLCHGTAGSYCQRNHMEDYYGHTGAFRCLVEGGGNVAFVKHTTVTENCDGKRKEWWARNQLTSDYELLCRDGTRAPARDYKSCFLGKVKSNAIVTSPRYSKAKIEAFINLFKYAQQYYGQKVPDEFSFSMFYSAEPFADLIFQDATQQLIVLPEEERDYTRYLDKDFLKAYTIVECRSGANGLLAISWSLLLGAVVALVISRA